MADKRRSLPWPLRKDQVFGQPSLASDRWVGGRRTEERGWVRTIQKALGVEETGVYSLSTRQAVIDRQREEGSEVTGLVDRSLWRALTRGADSAPEPETAPDDAPHTQGTPTGPVEDRGA